MIVSEIRSYLSWAFNVRNIDTYKTYHYDKGNNVTTVEHQSQSFPMYDSKGSVQETSKGTNVDVKV